ncbi:MAG: hypothetical protein ACFFD4_01025 [Candidatus Odinarchaeota archaeon]
MILIKIGGSCLHYPQLLAQECKILSEINEVVLVPGGGPFADVVREQAEYFKIQDDEAHWMAVLAMNQFGYLLSKMVGNSHLCETIGEIKVVRESSPVIWLPYLEMKKRDPLPHTWDVTSDSITAWMSTQLGTSYFVKVTAFEEQLPPVTVTGDTLLKQTRLIDPHLPEYLNKFNIECHVLCMKTISTHSDYYRGKCPPDMVIKPEKVERMGKL